MSITPPQVPLNPVPAPASGRGLVIASVICGAIGMIFPPLAPVALILGIIAIVRGTKQERNPPLGLAITGTVLGGLGLLVGCLILPGILLPALGKARQTARQLKSATQMQTIAHSLGMYATTWKDWYPPHLAAFASDMEKNENPTFGSLLVSPHAGPGQVSYFYAYPGRLEPTSVSNTIILVENPEFYRGRGANVAMADGHVVFLSGDDFWTHVEPLEFEGGVRLTRPR